MNNQQKVDDLVGKAKDADTEEKLCMTCRSVM